ncbi:ubiquitin-like modifier-activating enzyme ATG-7 [Colletotrichum plurivorum]|uniref:Ubiquitin-like modifier-activating enzyme ATG-7 n=1 Tax=Colletotrichum plurivorum TaxID=2175906 RepID=A0A8H6JHK6_9PEZI|nr:ubiquitin-like modifier-activating enzyme ATG-7 [Colletotrichum plurivorum]
MTSLIDFSSGVRLWEYKSNYRPSILDVHRSNGWSFVKRALQEKDYVAGLSGLAEGYQVWQSSVGPSRGVRRRKHAAAMELEDEEGLHECDGDLFWR